MEQRLWRLSVESLWTHFCRFPGQFSSLFGPNPSLARPRVRPRSVPDAHASFSRGIFSTACYVTSTCHVVYSQAGERVSWNDCLCEDPANPTDLIFSSLHTHTHPLSNPTKIFPHKTLLYCMFQCRSPRIGLKWGLKRMPARLMTKLHQTLTYSNVSLFLGYVTFFSIFFLFSFFKASFPWGLECARTCSTGETASTFGNPIYRIAVSYTQQSWVMTANIIVPYHLHFCYFS